MKKKYILRVNGNPGDVDDVVDYEMELTDQEYETACKLITWEYQISDFYERPKMTYDQLINDLNEDRDQDIQEYAESNNLTTQCEEQKLYFFTYSGHVFIVYLTNAQFLDLADSKIMRDNIKNPQLYSLIQVDNSASFVTLNKTYELDTYMNIRSMVFSK